MGKNKSNRVRNLNNLGVNTDNLPADERPIVKETVKSIDVEALEARGSDYLGQILFDNFGGRWDSSFPGSFQGYTAVERAKETLSRIPAQDDMHTILSLMVDSATRMNDVALITNILDHSAFSVEDSKFAIVKDVLPTEVQNKLDDTKIRYCAMQRSIIVAEDAAHAMDESKTNTPAATPVNAKPSANNAIAVGPTKPAANNVVCAKCGKEMATKDMRKVNLSDKVIPMEEHGKYQGTMVCQSCLNELQSSHAATIKAAIQEVADALTLAKGKSEVYESGMKLESDKAMRATFEKALAANKVTITQLEESLATLKK